MLRRHYPQCISTILYGIFHHTKEKNHLLAGFRRFGSTCFKLLRIRHTLTLFLNEMYSNTSIKATELKT